MVIIAQVRTVIPRTSHIITCFHFSNTGTANADLTKEIHKAKHFTIFGPKRDEVTGEWRRLHNGDLYDPYYSPSTIRMIKSRRMRWVGHVASMGDNTDAYVILVGRPEGKRPLGRPTRRWEDNIKMDLQEVG
jgi:hypothetical protein